MATAAVESRRALESLQQRNVEAIVACVVFLPGSIYGEGLDKVKQRLLASSTYLTKLVDSSKAARGSTVAAETPKAGGVSPERPPPRAMPRPASMPGDAEHSLTPWRVAEVRAALLRETALGRSLPAVLAAVVRGYLDGDWVALLSSSCQGGVVSAFATSSFERWDELPVVADPPEDNRGVCKRIKTQVNAHIADEIAVVEERLATKGPWTRLGDFCTPRAMAEAAACVCVRGELLVYGETRPVAHYDVDITERLSLSDGCWRSATHANDGGEYAAAYASVAGAGKGNVASVTLSALAPKGNPLHECVRLYYAKAQCVSFGEGKADGASHSRSPAGVPAVMTALALPSTAVLFSVCRLERAAGGAGALTSVRGANEMGRVRGTGLFHYLLDEETGSRAVAAASTQQGGRAVALPNGEMLVIGLWEDKREGHVEIYSPATDSWRLARWTVPNHRPDYLGMFQFSAVDALFAGGLLHVLFERHILIARLDPADAAAPVEWRMMHLPYGMRSGTLVRITPDQYNTSSCL